jgi:Ca2+:H+ antiporter
MIALLKEIRHNPLLWLLFFVPVVFIAGKAGPEAHTLLFLLSILAIVPLAALLSQATESVAAKTGDAVGGLLNATLGNLTELVIALATLRRPNDAGKGVHRRRDRHQHLVHAGGVVSPRRHQTPHAGIQPDQRPLAGRAALSGYGRAPGPVGDRRSRFHDRRGVQKFKNKLNVGLAVLLIAAYGLGMLFSLKTHREFFGSVTHGEEGEDPWPIGLALATLVGVTVLVALVSEIFVESVQEAAVAFGMTPAFVGFIVVALVGAAAEMASAFSGARKNRLDLSVGIALGSASQIALFVAPVLVLLSYVIGPAPMDLRFWPGAVVMMLIAALTASLVTNSGRSAWFVGVLVLMVYLIFALTLYLLPPGTR